MKIYISSSWKNQHAVELLTAELERMGHTVKSFVRESFIRESRENIRFDLDEWIASADGEYKFKYDTGAAMNSDLVIYISPSGSDAWAEVGAAWASTVPVFGLHAKGETIGLMRRMMTEWFSDYKDLLAEVLKLEASLARS